MKKVKSWDEINQNLKDFIDSKERYHFLLFIRKIRKKISKIVIDNSEYIGDKKEFQIKYDEAFNINEVVAFFEEVYPRITKRVIKELTSEKNNIIYSKKDNEESRVEAQKLILNLHSNIGDIYTMVHELIHKIYTTLNSNYVYFFVTELNSITFEHIVYDYIKNTNNYFENDIFMNNRIEKVLRLAGFSEFIDWVIPIFEEYGYVDKNIVAEKILEIKDEKLRNLFIKNVNNYISTIDKEGIVWLYRSQTYVLATVVAPTLNKRLKENKISLEELLNTDKKICDSWDILEILNAYNLNFIENDDILKEIEENFHNDVKEKFQQQGVKDEKNNNHKIC